MIWILIESEKHSVYQKEIEQEFGLRPSTATELMRSMEQKGLISRIPEEFDGRYKRIVFQEKATEMKEALRQEIEESECLLLRGISEEEQKEFMRIAGKMLQNLDSL